MPRSLVAAPPRSARPRNARPQAPAPLDGDLTRLNGGLLAGEAAEPPPFRLALDPPGGVVPRREPAVWSEFFGLWA